MAKYVGGASADSSTVSLPAAAVAGDIAIVLAFSTNLSSQPTVPSGWTALSTQTVDNTTDQAQAVAYKFLDSADISGGIGTWTNATSIAVVVYRGLFVSITANGASTAYSNVVTFPALTFLLGRTWVVAFGSHNSPGTNALKDRALTSYTNRSSGWASNKIGAWDTNGFVANTSSRTATVTDTDANVGRVVAVTIDEDEWEPSGEDVLAANGLVSSSFVAQPSLGQKHALTASGAASASVTSNPAISQKHSLIGVALSSATTVSQSTISQNHALTATGITSATSVPQPALGVKVLLDAVGVSAASLVQSAALAQKQSFAAVGVSSGSSVQSASIAQKHSLSAVGVSSTSSVGSSTLVANSGLTANGCSSSSTVGSPAIQQLHSLTASGVSSASTVGVPSSGSNTSLTANPVASASTVGAPALNQQHGLLALPVYSQTTVAAATLNQVHGLGAVGVSSASSVGTTAINQVHHIQATGINSASFVGQPAAVINVSLSAGGLVSSSAVAATPLSQLHTLSCSSLVSQSFVGVPSSGSNVSLTASPIVSSSAVGSPTIVQQHSIVSLGVSSNSFVAQPAITQQHALNGLSIGSASSVANPSIAQSHIIVSNGVSSAPNVSAATLNQTHSLAATGVASASSVGSSAISQIHSITASSITSTSHVGIPSSGSNISLTANPLAAASSVSNPLISQAHALSASGVASLSTVATASISQRHSLSATSVSSASLVAQPALTVNSGMVASGVSSVSSVGQPAINQRHSLLANSIASASSVGQPSSGANVSLTANSLSSASSVGSPSLSQRHSLAANGVSSTSSVAQPIANTNAIFTASGINSATFTATPSIAQKHSLTAVGIASASSVGMPSSGSNNAFEAISIFSGTSVGDASTSQLHSLTATPIVSASRVESSALSSSSGGQGLMVVQPCEDGCCDGEPGACYPNMWATKCSIGWQATGDCSSPLWFRVLKDGVVTIGPSNALTYSEQTPEGEIATYTLQYCVAETAEECSWQTFATITVDTTGEVCSLCVAAAFYPIGAFRDGDGIWSIECDAVFRVLGAAAKQDFVSPNVTNLAINGSGIWAGSASQVGGCFPGDNTGCGSGPCISCYSGPCTAADLCDPYQPPDDFTGTIPFDIAYPIPFEITSVEVQATNADGDTQACEIEIPCSWHWNAFRIEVPEWEGQTLSCNGGDPKPIGFDFSLGNRWRQTWSTAMSLTGSIGGTYVFHTCYNDGVGPSFLIGTGTFSYTYEEAGKIAYHTSAAPLVRLEADYTRRYTYEGPVEYHLVIQTGVDTALAPGYTDWQSLSTDPLYSPAYVRIRVVFPDNELPYDVDLSHEHSGFWEDPYPIVATGVQEYSFFVNTLMAVTAVERDIDCAESEDMASDITWSWYEPFDYAVVYEHPTEEPDYSDFPMPPIGGVNGGGIGSPGDACSCINEGSQSLNTETLVFEHIVVT